MRLILLFIFTAIAHGVFAQSKHTLSGTIKDENNGEYITGASISVDELPGITRANEYGFYSLTLPEGTYTVMVSYAGYLPKKQTITLDKSMVLNWDLGKGTEIQEVVLSSKKKDANLTQAKMGTETLNMKEIDKIPVIFGEKDIIKTIQLLPGVKSAGEGSSGFSVRGGTTDQNLILLDEAPVYNASHLLGFFSTFNSDAIKDVTIIKGNSPAQYGGRLSSVLDIKMKEGNNQNYGVSGGLGLISSRLLVEGPIQKEKSSFIISGRRTYADLFLKATEDFKDNTLYFYDLNAKGNFKINENNKIYFSGYFGKDVLGFGDTFNTDWGNTTATLRWNSILSKKLFLNTSLIYSNFDYNIDIKNGDTDFNINSNIKDWNLKQDYSYYLTPSHKLRFGFNTIHHTITPSVFSGTVQNNTKKNSRQSWENALYISNEHTVNEKLTLDYGLRLSAYSLLGGDTYNLYNKGVLYESIVLEKGEMGKTYFNLEPRVIANYRINQVSSLKAGYSRNTQNLHLMSNTTSGNPTDQWLGNSYNTKPEIADQVSVGYSRNFNENKYEVNTEVYYKKMQNQVDYKDGADLTGVQDVESELLYGDGRAYGLEILFKKKTGKLTGWIAYTLSKTERKIEGINNNEWYNAKQDRTHDISIVAMYQLTPRWSLGSTFIYNTGNAVTFPVGKYNVNGNTVYEYANRNANRMPANHRLDISATYDFRKKRRYESSLNIGLYNVYGRENAYSITFRDNENDPTKTEAVQTSLFRWVPSITYNFKF